MKCVLISTTQLAVLAASTFALGQEVNLQDRFLKEAPSAWADYTAHACRAQGQFSSEKVNSQDGKTILVEGPDKFKINGSLALWSKPSTPDHRSRLVCKNPDYEFVIDANSTTEWSLAQLIRGPGRSKEFSITHSGTDRIGSSPWQQVMSFTCKGLLINSTWLPSAIRAPSFKIISASFPKPDNGPIRVDFKYEPSNPGSDFFRGGYVVLDPSRYWLIKSAEVDGYEPKQKVSYKVQIENEFDDSTLGFPFVKKQVLRTFSPGVADYRDTYLITLQELPVSDVESFRLPAYGIPEPEPLRKRLWSSLVFWNLVVILFLIVAILFRRLSHRSPESQIKT